MPDKNPIRKTFNQLKATVKITQLTVQPVSKSPDRVLGELFQAVQLSRLHPDGKTFVDQVPSARMRQVVRRYRKEADRPDFDLYEFVAKNFADFTPSSQSVKAEPSTTAEDHIIRLWPHLTKTAYKSIGSLIALPNPYVVPGGRFQEQFYWDAYFIMLGLEVSGRSDLTDCMMSNYSHMFRKLGFIPTGNRTYFTSRSQPPFYSLMIDLMIRRKGKKYLTTRLPYLLQEYHFWNKHSRLPLKPKRRVKLDKNTYLNRYYDNYPSPRPESYSEDVETAKLAKDRTDKQVYLDLKAGAESGWDFSSRWFDDPMKIETIRTTNLIPVDLNCLLYKLELTIADCYRTLLQFPLAKYYRDRATKRKAAINHYLWDESKGFFFDYDFVNHKKSEDYTLAGVFALYVGLADDNQAAKVAGVIEDKFLKDGGVVTTLQDTGQQWDWPNGWAPLQWTTIVGLRRYGYHELADAIKFRWLATNEALYLNEGKFVEKYNVVDPTERGGGGEYQLQDGFGWTNGVFLALKKDFDVELSA
ncbi:MAG TPA: alpha,alpha-trehalase TreF [Candidatus Saccharimonadales bacterium]|nr:alpha,alpha-trehalase TreF [Candidatus Saccharimonadales bacterium]